MELYLVEKSDDMITIRISNADMTIITPFMDRLSEDKDVENVRYIEKHPDLDEPVFTVKVSKGKPEAALERAADAMSDYFSGFNIKRS